MSLNAPTYNQNAIKPEIPRIPGVGLNSNEVTRAFQPISQLSEPIGALSNMAVKIADEEKKKADDLRVTEALSGAIDKKSDLINNPEYGLLTKQGKNAFDSREVVGGSYEKYIKEVENSLQNETQKSEFRQKVTPHILDLNGDIDKHVFGETRKFEETTRKGMINSTINDMTFKYQNPGVVNAGLETIKQESLKQAQAAGLSQDATDLLIQENTHNANASVVSRMIDLGDHDTAHHYLEHAKDQNEISADQYNDLSKALKGVSIKTKAESIASHVLETNDPNPRQKIKELSGGNVEIYDEAYQRYKSYDAESKRLAEFSASENFKNSYNILQTSQGRADIPDSQMRSLSPEHQQSLQKIKDQLLQGKERQTNQAVFSDLYDRLTDPQVRASVSKSDIYAHIHELSQPSADKLFGMIDSIQKKDYSTVNVNAAEKEVMNSVMQQIGITGAKDDIKQRGLFTETALKALTQAKIEKKRNLTLDEISQTVHGLATKVVTDKGFIFNTEKRLFEVTKDNFDISAVPDADKQEIVSVLTQKYGRVPADSEVVDRYLLFLQKNGGLSGK